MGASWPIPGVDLTSEGPYLLKYWKASACHENQGQHGHGSRPKFPKRTSVEKTSFPFVNVNRKAPHLGSILTKT